MKRSYLKFFRRNEHFSGFRVDDLTYEKIYTVILSDKIGRFELLCQFQPMLL